MKNQVWKWYTVVLLMAGYPGNCAASVPYPADTLVKQAHKLLLFPIVTRTPETSFGFGIVGSYTFRPKQADSLSRTSNIQAVSLYTINRQALFVVEGSFYAPAEKYIFRFQASYSLFPDRFWGIGNQTPANQEEQYSFAQMYVYPQLLRKIRNSLFFGISYQYQRVYNFQYNHDGLFEQENILGRYGSSVSGAGLLMAWDSRNNAFSPSQGELVQFSYTRFDPCIGSNFSFNSYLLDVRKFIALWRQPVLAFQLVGSVNIGQVPIRNLATLGGATIMRGYYSGRFRDNTMVAGQVEYRQRVWWRFGMVAFASLGQVGDKVGDLRLNEFKYAFGGGIRFALKEKEKLNLRLDYGIANHSTGLYLMIAESF